MSSKPDLTYELAAMAQGCRIIAGVDEVGRGPLCGPVTAAAVVLDWHNIPNGIHDSKKLTAKNRDRLYDEICATAAVCVVHVEPAEIDAINILQASLRAMERAVAGLHPVPDYVLVDGNRLPAALPCRAQAIVKGDSKSLSIAAASIIAKVTRDRLMAALARDYPAYGWDRNAGYPTKEHLAALQEVGVTPYHRRSFAPVRNILCK